MSTCSVFMPRLPLAPVLARPSLRSSLAIVFGCSCLDPRPLPSSLLPRRAPHPRSSSGVHASTPARSGPRSSLAAILTRDRLRVFMRDPPSLLARHSCANLRFSLDVDVQQTLRQPLELVAPPRVVGARQAAQLDAYRTWTCGGQPKPDPAPAHHN